MSLDSLAGSVVAEVERFAEIVVALVFGSHGTGRQRADSDVDVAVVFATGVTGERRFQIRCLLSERLAAAAGTASADVVDLERAPPLLAHAILRTGRLLLSRDERRRIEVTSHQIARYLDTAPMRKQLDDATYRRFRGERDGLHS